MNIARLIRQQCVITTRTQTGPPDEFGSPTWEETDTADLIHIQPVTAPSTGETMERPGGRLTHKGFLRPSSNIGHADKVTLATGQQWDVDGAPRLWTHPRTLQDVYIEVDLVGFTELDDEESSS